MVVQTLNFPQVQFAVLLVVIAVAIFVLLDVKRRVPQVLLAALIACGLYQACFRARFKFWDTTNSPT